jgi:hypothetical protein
MTYKSGRTKEQTTRTAVIEGTKIYVTSRIHYQLNLALANVIPDFERVRRISEILDLTLPEKASAMIRGFEVIVDDELQDIALTKNPRPTKDDNLCHPHKNKFAPRLPL